jgi:hypothetical protein
MDMDCFTATLLAMAAAIVGWVERSDTHHSGMWALMGAASLHPSYSNVSRETDS